MSNALIDERPILLLPTLVKAFGFEKAALIQQVHWLLNQPKSGVEVDGVKHVYGTYEEWCEDYFRFWQPRTLRHHITSLERQGIFKSCQPKIQDWDRTKYYTIDYNALSTLIQEASEELKGAQSVTSMRQAVDTSMRQPLAASKIQAVAASYIDTETSTETSYREVNAPKNGAALKQESLKLAATTTPIEAEIVEAPRSYGKTPQDLVSFFVAWNDNCGVLGKSYHDSQTVKLLRKELKKEALVNWSMPSRRVRK